MSGESLNLDAIEDEAEKARRFLRSVRLSPETALALVGEVRRLREERDAIALMDWPGEAHRLQARVAVLESVDALAVGRGYSHAQAAEQLRVAMDLADDVQRRANL